MELALGDKSLHNPNLPSTVETALLHSIAELTWRGIEKMADTPTGLPIDTLPSPESSKHPHRLSITSPTNIGLYLADLVAARELGFSPDEETIRKIESALTSIEDLGKIPIGEASFFANWYDTDTGEVVYIWPETDTEIEPFVSTIDTAWMEAGLVVAGNTFPEFKERIANIRNGIDYSVLQNIPTGLLHGAYRPSQGLLGWKIDVVNTEGRMAYYLGIAKGNLSPETFTRLVASSQEMAGTSDGMIDGYLPSWDGTMFEALMPMLFVPEAQWGRGNFGISHSNYVRQQIQDGQNNNNHGYWGVSPCMDPDAGTYEVFGIPRLGLHQRQLPSDCARAVVSPYAMFLAAEIAPDDVYHQMSRIEQEFSSIKTPFGLLDAVSPSTGQCSDRHLMLDQSMTLLAIANITNGCIRKAFSSEVEDVIQPILNKWVLAGSENHKAV